MRTYNWNNPTLIARVSIEKRLDDKWATLHPVVESTDAVRKKLQELPAALAERGYRVYVDVEGGESVLRVTGVKRPEELLKVLKATGSVPESNPRITKGKLRGHKQNKTIWEKIQKNAFRIRGTIGAFGCFCMYKRNQREKYMWKHEQGYLDTLTDKQEGAVKQGADHNFGTMAAYLIKDFLNFFYGGGKSEIEFDKLMHRLEAKVYTAGEKLNKIDFLRSDKGKEQDGALLGAYKWFRKNTPAVSEAIPMYGNWKKMCSGVRMNPEIKRPQFVDPWQFYTGASHMVGDIIGAWVPEESKENIETNPKSPWFKKNQLYQFISDKPLKIQGWLSLSNKPAQFVSVFTVMQDPTQKMWGFLESLSFTFSRVFGALASKKSDNPSDVKDYEPAFAMVANRLLGLSDKERDGSLTVMAEELAEDIRKIIKVKIDADKVADKIREKITLIEESPFMQLGTGQGAASVEKNLQPIAQDKNKETSAHKWEKIIQPGTGASEFAFAGA